MKKLLVIGSMLIFGLLSNQANAQEKLLNWLKKCENNNAIDMTVISTNDPSNKGSDTKMITFSIKTSDPLWVEFTKIMEVEKEKASSNTEKREGGIVKSQICVFNQNNYSHTFIIKYSKETPGTVKIMYAGGKSGHMGMGMIGMVGPMGFTSFDMPNVDVKVDLKSLDYLKSDDFKNSIKEATKNSKGKVYRDTVIVR